MTSPRISCVVTAFNEGDLAAVSIRSLLAQSFDDFEILLVDDGADAHTRAVLHSFDDPRIRHIRQSNDGLSAARNRGLAAARGDYVCFLDADDSRPPWAFAAMAEAARGGADCVFSPGILSEVRHETYPFYDQAHFQTLQTKEMDHASDPAALSEALPYLACLEPQAANKMVRRDFLERHRLRFPPGLFFEDMFFHVGLLANLDSYAVTDLPAFTYFRRYARPQITGDHGTRRFDAISTAISTLHLFEHAARFEDKLLRTMVLASTFKLLSWCQDSISHDRKYGFGQALRHLVTSLDQRWLGELDPATRRQAAGFAPWVAPSLDHASAIAGVNAEAPVPPPPVIPPRPRLHRRILRRLLRR